MYYRSRKPIHQNYLLYAAVILVAVVVVALGGNAVRKELQEVKETQGQPDQTIHSDYSKDPEASQENRPDSSENNRWETPAPTSDPAPSPESSAGDAPSSSNLPRTREDSPSGSRSRHSETEASAKNPLYAPPGSAPGSLRNEGDTAITAPRSGAESKSDPSPERKDYVITVFQGKIALFESDRRQPLKVLDSPASYFPPEDQALLTQGIHAESLSEAMGILEDYQ